MNRKYGIGAVTGGANHWTPRHRTAWQAERQYGKLLPMEAPSLLQRMREKWARG